MSDVGPLPRRLAALLSADVEGYSRLMGADDVGTVRMLTEYRGVLADLVAAHHGRVVEARGDNLLAEFGRVLDAVECAIEAQRALAARNASIPGARWMQFRIGINLGDVIADGQRIYGEGVNIAARLERLADAGGVCLSGAAYDALAGKLPYELQSLGEHTATDIASPMRVYRVLLGGDPVRPRAADAPAVASVRPLPAHGSRRLPSIAVLPFRDYDAPHGRSYFADGMIEDVVSALSCLPDLFVISRSSTLSFHGGITDVRIVGQKLGVRYVLSGSVRRRGARIRTVAELSDTETRAVLWTERVEGAVDDLFALQDRLSERIVATIAPQVRPAELRRALAKRPDNLDAYDAVLRGLDLLYRLRRDEFDQAHAMFLRAMKLHDGWATPYALAAIWHSIRIGQGWSLDRRRDYDEANRLATAALERDPFDARALALCGHVRARLFRDDDGAFELFERAIAASPNSFEAWAWSSPAFSSVGDGAEARHRAEHALRLSPFDPQLFYAQAAVALACYTSGGFEEATAWGRKAIAHNPRNTAALQILIASLAAAGRVAEAAEFGRALLDLEPAFRVDEFARDYAYRDAPRRAALAVHLRAAGLPT